MATGGQIRTNTAFGYVQLAWTLQSQDVANNKSTIAYTLSINRTSNISSSAAKNYSITINGTKVASGTVSIGGSGTTTLKAGTTTIAHNSDGSKVFSYSFSQQIDITWSGSWIGTVTGSGSGTLPTIPRATTPTLSAASTEMGSVVTITMNRASSSFTHTLKYTFGSASGTIGTGLGTSQSWTIPLALASQIPNATSGTGTITCETYNGSTLVGTKSVAFTATVPASVVPVINTVTITEATEGLAAKFGAFVQSKSTLNIAITATGAYSSTIKTYKTTVDGVSYTTNPAVSARILNSGQISVSVAVTDSRGRGASVVKTIDVIAYEQPKIIGFTAYRADSTGAADYEGQYLQMAVNFSISPVNNLNDKYYEIVYREKGTTQWSNIASSTSLYTLNNTVLSGAVFNADKSYDVALNVYDYFGSASVQLDVPTAFTLIDFRSTGKGIAFGKVSQADRMEIALDVEMTGEFMQEARKTATLQNNWTNYGAAYESATYWKDKCGNVHLAGLIKGGTTTAETVIFTLPEGYRPRVSEKFFCVSMNAICVIDVYTSGAVAIKTGANSGWLSLSGVSFRAA